MNFYASRVLLMELKKINLIDLFSPTNDRKIRSIHDES